MLSAKLNYTGKYQHSKKINIPKYQYLISPELIQPRQLKAPNIIINTPVITTTILTDIVWKPTHDIDIYAPKPVIVPAPEPAAAPESELEPLPVAAPESELEPQPAAAPESELEPPPAAAPESAPESAPENDNTTKVETLGFIILRNVTNPTTNEYWKECFRCIRRFYPNNRILIIDDNSNKQFVTNDVLNNTMIIESEFPKRGEFLPYYYYLRTNFCQKVVILHDSMFIKRHINFDGMVSDYKFLIHFGKEHINDPRSFQSQFKLLRSLNNTNLTTFYNKKDEGSWSGCFGSMSVITYDFLKQIDDEFRLMRLIPVITQRVDRCAFERILGCILQYKHRNSSLMGDIVYNLDWRIDYNRYKNHNYNFRLPIVKIFTGR
jgi:hypothetical protein